MMEYMFFDASLRDKFVQHVRELKQRGRFPLLNEQNAAQPYIRVGQA